MKKKSVATLLITGLLLTSCQQTTQETKNDSDSSSKTEKETDFLIGSWVEPNPINESEVQGLTMNEDGTAKSINMATLVYKKWWKENGKLILVSESIGNGVSGIDTAEFEIIKLNKQELEIKDGDYVIKYKRQ